MPIMIILSFTKALDGIASGALTEENLAQAIFCPGCMPDAVFKLPIAVLLEEQFPYQAEQITAETVETFRRHAEQAEKDGRIVWRRKIEPSETHRRLSALLVKQGGEGLNPNLPPSDENDLLKTAIERVNNKDGHEKVQVIC